MKNQTHFRNEVDDLKDIIFPYLMCSAVFKNDIKQLEYCLEQVKLQKCDNGWTLELFAARERTSPPPTTTCEPPSILRPAKETWR